MTAARLSALFLFLCVVSLFLRGLGLRPNEEDDDVFSSGEEAARFFSSFSDVMTLMLLEVTRRMRREVAVRRLDS